MNLSQKANLRQRTMTNKVLIMLNKIDKFFDILLVLVCTVGGAAITYFLAGIIMAAILQSFGIKSEYLIYIVGIPFGFIGAFLSFAISAIFLNLIDGVSTLLGKVFAIILSKNK